MYFWYLSSPFPPDRLTFSVPFLCARTIKINNTAFTRKNPTPHGARVTCANHRVPALGRKKGIQVGALPAHQYEGAALHHCEQTAPESTKLNRTTTEIHNWAGVLCLGGKPSALRTPALAGCVLVSLFIMYNPSSSAFQQKQTTSQGAAASQGPLTHHKALLHSWCGWDVPYTWCQELLSRVSEDAFPLPKRKKRRVSLGCDEKSLPWPAAPCRALFGTHNYLLCNGDLLHMWWCALFIKYLMKAAPEHTHV